VFGKDHTGELFDPAPRPARVTGSFEQSNKQLLRPTLPQSTLRLRNTVPPGLPKPGLIDGLQNLPVAGMAPGCRDARLAAAQGWVTALCDG
jgi:hypothetical protein